MRNWMNVKGWRTPLLAAGLASTFALSAGVQAQTPTTDAPPATSKAPAEASPDPLKVPATTSGSAAKPITVRAESTDQQMDKKRKQEFWKSLLKNHRLAWLSGELNAPTDTIETTDRVKVTMEVPGLDEDALDVTVARESITVRGEKLVDTAQKAEDFRRIERAYGSFEKTIRLPAEVDAAAATAELRDGILTIMLPKMQGAGNDGKKLSIKRQ